MDKLIRGANKKLFSDKYSVKVRNANGSALDSHLPPSSFETFLKKKRNIAGFVLAPFASIYDYKSVLLLFLF